MCRVARLLEADREVAISRAPRLLLELYETLMAMVWKMRVSGGSDGKFQSVFVDFPSPNFQSCNPVDSSSENSLISITQVNPEISSQD